MAARVRPYSGVPPSRVLLGVCNGSLRPALPAGAPAGVAALASACWAHEPAERPRAGAVLAALRAPALVAEVAANDAPVVAAAGAPAVGSAAAAAAADGGGGGDHDDGEAHAAAAAAAARGELAPTTMRLSGKSSLRQAAGGGGGARGASAGGKKRSRVSGGLAVLRDGVGRLSGGH